MLAISSIELEEASSWLTALLSLAWRSAIQRSYLAWISAIWVWLWELVKRPTTKAAVETPNHAAVAVETAAIESCFCVESTKL